MAIPLLGAKMRPLIDAYREAWVAAGHPGRGRVMLAFHMFCDEDPARARRLAREPVNHYLQSIYEAACDWTVGTTSKDYPGYDTIIAGLAAEDFDTTAAKGGVWVGSPDDIVGQVQAYRDQVGPFEVASLQVNFASLPYDESRRSVELFGREVLPRLAELDRVVVA
jgi:alkanesulfonate monooxygenase SsuD/methylene tetrahydromethanopterin reductase-like flavin-dependent oxidoreductase (luciferase family)